jgi:hypothetical protein
MHVLQRIGFHSEDFSFRVMPPSLTEPSPQGNIGALWLFLLDACSLHRDLVPLVNRCRSLHPGSKFLVFLAPDPNNIGEKVRLFCWGVDGFDSASDAGLAARSAAGIEMFTVPDKRSQKLLPARKYSGVCSTAG